MDFLKRAYKNILRRKTKTILLILTFFIIANLVLIGLGVGVASNDAMTLTRQKMTPVVSYEVDYEKIEKLRDELDEDELQEFYDNYPRVSLVDAIELSENEHVVGTNIGSTNEVFADDIEPFKFDVPGRDEPVFDSEEEKAEYELYNEERVLKLKGYTTNSTIEFEQGQWTLIDGDLISDSDYADGNAVGMIEQGIAELNGISVGDIVTVRITSNYDVMPMDYGFDSKGLSSSTEDQVEHITYDIEVVGIYDDSEELDPNNEEESWLLDQATFYPENSIIVPFNFIGRINFGTEKFYSERYDYEMEITDFAEYLKERIYFSAIYLLDDPLEVASFVEENERLMDNEYLYLNANNQEFEKYSKPLETISFVADIMLYIVVFNAVVIISLITALTLKTREYEIGVLLSLGEGRFKIILQLIFEMVIIAVIAFLLSYVSGSIITKRVGESVLEYQITENSVEEENDYYYSYYNDFNYFTEISQDDFISEYSVSISFMEMLKLLAIGLGVIIISVVIPGIMITGYNPKKIMMNR